MKKMRRSRLMRWMVIMCVSIFLSANVVGCSWISKITGSEDPVKNAYSGLYGTGSVYNMGLASVSMLQKQGVVSAQQREVVNKAAAIFRATYFSAVDYLGLWKLNQGTVNEGEIQVAIQNIVIVLTQNWSSLQQAINALSPGLIQGDFKLSLNKKADVKTWSNPGLSKRAEIKKDPKKLDPTLVPILISAIGLVVQYAIPEAIKLFEAMKKPQITLEDIKALKDLVKDPATY